MKTLYDYQAKDKKAIISAWSEFRSILYQLPTGGGKSIVLTSIIQDYKGEQILIFAHKRKLLLQLRDHLQSVGIKAGILAGQLQENLDSNIIIVSIRTAVKDARLESLLERNWDKVIIDEARHSRTGSYDKVLDALLERHPNHKLLGVDATPYRKDRKRLDKHFQHMISSSEDIASLTAKGFLQKCKTIVSPINKKELEEEVTEVANDYQITSLSNYMRKPKYLNYVVNQYLTYGENRQAIVFAVDKAHAKDIQQAFEDNGFAGKVVRVDSDMSESDIALAYSWFETKNAQILVNVEMITEGVDLPSAGCILGARPTKSLTLFMQVIGRGMRLDGIHDYFILLDCCGWTEEYGTISSPKHWSLNPEINPNGLRQGNKIFGRREDGKLTEDLEEFFGEVIEMTPDEYLQNLQGGKEKAEQINISIDDKITSIFDSLIDLFIKRDELAKDFNYTVDYEDSSTHTISFKYSKNNEKDRRWGHRVELVLNKRREKVYANINGSYEVEKETEYFELTQLLGKLNGKILKDKSLARKCLEIMETVIDLNKSKLNLDKFRRAEQKLAQEQKEQSIAEHCAINKKFEFTIYPNFTNYFREVNYESKGKITAIEIPSGKINNHHNTILLHLTKPDWGRNEKGESIRIERQSVEEKKYVKGEKLMEIINCEWNVEVDS